MRSLVQFSQALADETRWRIVQLVFDEALCVCELAGILRMPQSSVSSHLQVIRKAGLLEDERCEKWIYYRLDRRYRALIARLRDFFGVSPSMDSVLGEDAARARRRLARRAESCCPGPRRLAGRAGGRAGVAAAKADLQPA